MLTIRKSTVKESGGCNGCDVRFNIKTLKFDYRFVYVIRLCCLEVRLCQKCLDELKEKMKGV